MKGRFGEPSRTLTGEYVIPFITRESIALKVWDDLHEKEVCASFSKWHEKRSLDANAYFHVLVNHIAAALANGPDAPSDTDVKRRLVLDYGAIDRDDNGDIIGAKLPASVNVLQYYPYAKPYKTMVENGREYQCYIFYKRTRTLDSKEMARLIDGAVQEAKALGIETRSPQEIAAMEAAWEAQNG